MNRYQPGDLIQIINAPDQNFYTRKLCDKLGVVIENIITDSSTNIYKVLVEDRFCNLHALDMELLQRNGSVR
jgi:hypothetical protein